MMNKNSFVLTLLFLSLPAFSWADSEKRTAHVLAEATGDLDKDGVAEKVVILDLGTPVESSSERYVLIYKKNEDNWQLWKHIKGGILGPNDGGAMGDPFWDLKVSRGSLVIEHFGGSSQKWQDIHRFRYNSQNDHFELIGATVSYGANMGCGGYTLDYNLLTGKAIYQTHNSYCSDEDAAKSESTELKLPNDKRHRLQGYGPGMNVIVLPDSNKSIYY